MDVQQFLSFLGTILGTWGFFEWRIRTVENRMLDKLKDREEIQSVKIRELKEDIQEMKHKLDLIINLQLSTMNRDQNGKKDSQETQ